tara:strand:+ start:760 stop:1071 length:312 start_codon:yes stop_codon:yes gene_type:complete
MRTEKALEKWAVSAAKKRGIYAVKLVLLQGGGWPDVAFFQDGKVAFLELKKDEKSKFQPLQKYYLGKLNDMGFQAGVAWSNDMVMEFLDVFEGKEQDNGETTA